MATQYSIYEGTALGGRTFPSSKHIATKAHMAIWKRRVIDEVWEQTDIDEYQLINNSCVLNALVDTSVYDKIEVRVADAVDELVENPTDIAIVADIATEVTEVSDNMADVVIVAGNLHTDGVSGKVQIVSDNIGDVEIVEDNIQSVIDVAAALNSGGGIDGGGQYLGNGLFKGVEYFAQDSLVNDVIVVTSGTNAMSVESFTLKSGSSLTIENDSTYKIL